jgi:hypothetical protein
LHEAHGRSALTQRLDLEADESNVEALICELDRLLTSRHQRLFDA